MNRRPFLKRRLGVLSRHERVLQTVAISALVAIVGIDLFDLSDEFEDSPALGFVYVLLIAGSVTAINLLAHRDHRGWLLAAFIGLASAVAVFAGRAVGAPTTSHGIHTWNDPLGGASLLASACVVVASLAVISKSRAR